MTQGVYVRKIKIKTSTVLCNGTYIPDSSKPWSFKMVSGLELARRFHEVYERLAPSFGYETRKETKLFDPTSPNGKLMTAVCQECGDEIDRQSFQAGFQAGLREGRSPDESSK